MRRCLKFRGISSIIPRLPLRCHSHSPRAPLEASQGRLGAPSGRLGASWGDLVKILDALEAPKTTVRTYIHRTFQPKADHLKSAPRAD